MILTILAYILTLLLGPTIGGLAHMLILPITLKLSDLGISRFFVAVMGAMVSAFVATWIGVQIFLLLGKEPGILLILILCFSYTLNDLNRMMKGKNSASGSGYLVGDIAGIILGGYLFIFS